MKNFLNIILMLISIWVLMIGLSFTISIIGNPPLRGNPFLVHVAYWLFGPALCFMGGGIFFLCLRALQSDTKKPVKENPIHPATEKNLPSAQEEIESNIPHVEKDQTHPALEKSLPFIQKELNSNTTPTQANLIHHMAQGNPSTQIKPAKKVSGLETIILLIGLGILSAGLAIIDTYGTTSGDTALIQVGFGIILSLVGGGIFYLALRSLQYNSAKLTKKPRLPATQSEHTPTPEKVPNKKTPTTNIIIIIMLTISLFCLLMLGLFTTVLVFMFSGTISVSNPISQFALWGSIITGFALLMVIINTNKR